jgi:hypothetical protein
MWGRRLLAAISSNGRVAQAMANISGLLTLIGIAIAFVYSIRDWLTSTTLQLLFAGISVILSFGAMTYIYGRLYRKISNRYFKISGSRISYSGRLKYSIKLAFIDSNYFVSLIWIKMSRVLIMAMTALFLFLIYITDPHIHRASFTVFGQVIYSHALLDSATLLAFVTLICAILMNLHEINVIARGVSRLRIGAYWRPRKKA